MEVDEMVEKKEQLFEKYTEEEKLKYNKRIKQKQDHACLRNFNGASKSMETDAIVQLVKLAPVELNAYVRCICMDNGTVTRENLKEDTGKDSAGCFPKDLMGIVVLADPSHRK